MNYLQKMYLFSNSSSGEELTNVKKIQDVCEIIERLFQINYRSQNTSNIFTKQYSFIWGDMYYSGTKLKQKSFRNFFLTEIMNYSAPTYYNYEKKCYEPQPHDYLKRLKKITPKIYQKEMEENPATFNGLLDCYKNPMLIFTFTNTYLTKSWKEFLTYHTKIQDAIQNEPDEPDKSDKNNKPSIFRTIVSIEDESRLKHLYQHIQAATYIYELFTLRNAYDASNALLELMLSYVKTFTDLYDPCTAKESPLSLKTLCSDSSDTTKHFKKPSLNEMDSFSENVQNQVPGIYWISSILRTHIPYYFCFAFLLAKIEADVADTWEKGSPYIYTKPGNDGKTKPFVEHPFFSNRPHKNRKNKKAFAKRYHEIANKEIEIQSDDTLSKCTIDEVLNSYIKELISDGTDDKLQKLVNQLMSCIDVLTRDEKKASKTPAVHNV